MAKQRESTLDELKNFLTTRFEHWLDILEKPLLHSNKELNYYFDNKITNVDISLACVLDGFHEIFTGATYNEYIGNKHRHLEALYQRVTNRKGIRELLDKQNKAGKTFYPAYLFQKLIDHFDTLAKELESKDAVTTQKVAA